MTITSPPTCLHHLWGADDGLTCTREPGHHGAHVMAGSSVPHAHTPRKAANSERVRDPSPRGLDRLSPSEGAVNLRTHLVNAAARVTLAALTTIGDALDVILPGDNDDPWAPVPLATAAELMQPGMRFDHFCMIRHFGMQLDDDSLEATLTEWADA